MAEWDFDAEIAAGSPRRRVRLVQEWLCLHGHGVRVDGAYGPATTEAVREFQRRRGLSVTGRANRATFTALTEPLSRALCPIDARGRRLGELVAAHARAHLAERPREVGGQNRGPWVRLYMKGNEGGAWPWCAGFACFALHQAARCLALAPPIRASFSCDSLAASARERGRLLAGSQARTSGRITPGTLFLSRRTSTDWVHTGIVIASHATMFETIEGNTNDAGEREGYEVCRRIRGYDGKDFILVD